MVKNLWVSWLYCLVLNVREKFFLNMFFVKFRVLLCRVRLCLVVRFLNWNWFVFMVLVEVCCVKLFIVWKVRICWCVCCMWECVWFYWFWKGWWNCFRFVNCWKVWFVVWWCSVWVVLSWMSCVGCWKFMRRMKFFRLDVVIISRKVIMIFIIRLFRLVVIRFLCVFFVVSCISWCVCIVFSIWLYLIGYVRFLLNIIVFLMFWLMVMVNWLICWCGVILGFFVVILNIRLFRLGLVVLGSSVIRFECIFLYNNYFINEIWVNCYEYLIL